MERHPESGLYLPAEYVRVRDEAKQLGVGVYVTWDDVKDNPLNPDDVPVMLADLPYRDMLSARLCPFRGKMCHEAVGAPRSRWHTCACRYRLSSAFNSVRS